MRFHTSRSHRAPVRRRSPEQFTLETVEPRVLLASVTVARDLAASIHPRLISESQLPGWIVPHHEEHGGEHDDHDHEKPDWMANTFIPGGEFVANPAGFLSGPQRGKPVSIASNFLVQNAEALGTSGDLSERPVVTDAYRSDHNGVTHVYFRQQHNGLPILNANGNVNVARDGSVLSLGGWMMDTASLAAVPTTPATTANQAILSIADTIGVDVSRLTSILSGSDDAQQTTVLRNADLSLDDITAKLVYVATDENTLDLAWWAQLRLPGGEHWYELAISHQGEKVVFAADYVWNATYQVYEWPKESPSEGTRTVVTNPQDPLASPYGWHDTNGIVGAEFTIARGNNVHAYADIVSPNGYTAGQDVDAEGGGALDFQFPLDLTQAPSTYRPAAVTNLFYWNNLTHDVTYRYGFTEAAGNFQANNYGRGGVGNDAVLAEAQDYGGTNNANFATPPDGSPPRMQMFVWTAPTPDRDGDLDAGIVIHEYTHGISNRLTGGPSNASALNSTQSGGMGEGWSDYFGLMLTMKPTDTAAKARGIGTYALNQPTDGLGIRAYRYSPDMTINPMTIGFFNSNQAVHYAGTIWCTALWDMTWNLIAKYGKSSDIRTGYDPANVRGDQLALQLVSDGMKLQPSNPSFAQARDAILAADRALTGGLNQNDIWAAFAKRGMGSSFVSGTASSLSVTAAFDLPNPNPIGLNHTPTGSSLTPVSSVTINFNEPINPASFSIADDLAFSGPGGIDYKPQITGAVWATSTRLVVSFTPTAQLGTYTLEVGPNLLAADDGRAMDGNANGITGEPADRYVADFSYSRTLGPDSANYQAGSTYLRSLDLQIGQPGVVTLNSTSDDASTAINLGTNTFTYYGTTYTGATSLYASVNGLITLGGSNTAWTNGDLTTAPTQRAIAVLWDDWRADQNAPGEQDSAVLTRIDGDRLIVEWSSVTGRTSSEGAVTFQAILQLNTGSAPGAIILNYPDLITSNGAVANGASSSVGIKDTGTQGNARILVSQNTTTHPFVGSGKAIRISNDWTPPTVTSVAVENRDWSLLFRDHLRSLGHASGRYTLGAGTETLPWLSIDHVAVTFSEAISGKTADFTLARVGSASGATGYSYDPATRTASWSFVANNAQRFVARLSDAIEDARWLPLDGNADGVEGGTYQKAFNVLAGDVNGDGITDKNDLSLIRNRIGTTTSHPNYLARADLNGDGQITLPDLQVAAMWLGVALPEGSPAALASGRPIPPFAPPPRTTPATTPPPATVFADLFSRRPLALGDTGGPALLEV
jgi:extracellular elastinolytic metalloproteinase